MWGFGEGARSTTAGRGRMIGLCATAVVVAAGCSGGDGPSGREGAASEVGQSSVGGLSSTGAGPERSTDGLSLQQALNESTDTSSQPSQPSAVAPAIGAARPEGGATDQTAEIITASLEPQGETDTGAPLTIGLIQTRDVGAHEASIYWQLDRMASGQVAFGTTPELGSWSLPEDTYQYEEHYQGLTGLQPDTRYFYRVHSTDSNSEEVISELREFRTMPAVAAAGAEGSTNEFIDSAAVDQPSGEGPSDQETSSTSDETDEATAGKQQSAEGWPANADGDLAWAGIFYGNAITGQLATNSVLALHQTRRFRAQRSGDVVALRFQNRVLSDQNIATRCKRFGGSSQWCQCQNGGLDRYTCGYTLGNSYSVGNGGLIHVEVREDDGDGNPGERMLARTEAWVPHDLFARMESESNVTMQLDQPAALVAGRIYHMVHINNNPPTRCDVRNVPVDAARGCPRDQGLISLNGVYDRSYPMRTGRYGPFRGDSSMNLFRESDDGPWQESTKGLSYYELHYDDGQRFGESYHALDGDAEMKTVQGATRARQAFTVRDATREVDGVWVNFGHVPAADGSSLTAILRDDEERELASGSIEPSSACRDDSSGRCREWGHASFAANVTLIEGQRYSVDFVGEARAGFRLGSFQPLIAHGYRDGNYWSDARAELSRDGGSSWQEWSSQLGEHRDMGVLFTLPGMPRQLP